MWVSPHYLEVLGKKPGALAGSTALAQYRERGLWPESFDQLWGKLRDRHGKHEGTREMIELLLLSKEHGWAGLRRRIEEALARLTTGTLWLKGSRLEQM